MVSGGQISLQCLAEDVAAGEEDSWLRSRRIQVQSAIN